MVDDLLTPGYLTRYNRAAPNNMLTSPITLSWLSLICANIATILRHFPGYKNGIIPSSTNIKAIAASRVSHIVRYLRRECILAYGK